MSLIFLSRFSFIFFKNFLISSVLHLLLILLESWPYLCIILNLTSSSAIYFVFVLLFFMIYLNEIFYWSFFSGYILFFILITRSYQFVKVHFLMSLIFFLFNVFSKSYLLTNSLFSHSWFWLAWFSSCSYHFYLELSMVSG